MGMIEPMKARETAKISDKRNKVCTAIGKSLKKHRLEAEISQENLAFEADVDRTYISQIERGVANPSVIALANLCFVLGITLSELFESVTLSLPPDDEIRRTNRVRSVPKSRLR